MEAIVNPSDDRLFAERRINDQLIRFSREHSTIFYVRDRRPQVDPVSPTRRAPRWWLVLTDFVENVFGWPNLFSGRRSYMSTDYVGQFSNDAVTQRIHGRAYLIALLDSSGPFEQGLHAIATIDDPIRPLEILRLRLHSCLRSDWNKMSSPEYLWQLEPPDAAELLREYYQLSGRFIQLESIAARAGDAVRALPAATLAERTLAVYTGRVDRIDGNTAYVTVRSGDGTRMFAQMDVDELIPKGIGVGDRFSCELKVRGDETVLTLAPVARRRLTREQMKRISDRIDSLLPDELFGDDDERR